MARDPWASPRVILFAPPFSFHFTIHKLSYFGYLTKIEISDNSIKFYFSIVSSLPQAIFDDYAHSFNLMESKGENELDKVHWSIKNINLVKCIRNLGFNVASY